MNHQRLGELTIAWDCGELAFDVVAAALPLALSVPEASHAGEHSMTDSAIVTIQVRRAAEPHQSPASHGATPVLYHAGTRCFLDASGFWVWDGASRVHVSRDGTAIDVEVHERSFERSPAYFASVTIMMALLLALRAHGYFHVHACAAAWPDGERWLLPAESNAGKSTFGLALFSAGAAFLTDDALLVRRSAVEVQAIGWPRPMRMTHATAAAFPALSAIATPCPPGSARDLEIDPRLAFAGRGVPSMTGPFTLLFPGISHQPVSQVRALDRAEAFGRLLHACAWVASEHVPLRDEQLELMRSLVDASRAYEVAAGTGMLRDPLAELAAIRAQLA